MKFTVFVLIAGLCLASVSANGGSFSDSYDEDDLEFVPPYFADEMMDIDSFGAFGPMYFIFKAALRSLKGVNCTIKGVMNMRNAAQQFLDDINSCGGQVTKQLQAVINSCKTVISTCNDIINLNENVCNNGDYNNETDGKKKTPWSCFWKLLGKMISLKKQISKTLGQIKKVPKAGTDAGNCVTTALSDLSTTFTTFPTFVKNCSKLTSK